MSDRQRKLGAAPVDVDGPGQPNTRLSPEIPGDASVNIECYIERARPRDKKAGLFLDRSHQHARNHRREFVGPLNRQRSPQGEPVTFAARDSEDGRRLGASVADGNFTKDFAKTLAELGRAFGRLDFSQHDLDAPFPAEAVKYGQNTFRTQAANITRVATEENLSLRETVLYFEHRILNRSPAPPRRSPTRSSGGCRATRPTASSVT